MAKWTSAAAALVALAGSTTPGHSKHRPARISAFIHRHRRSHRAIIGKLRRKLQKYERHCDRRFHRHAMARARAKVEAPKHTDPLPWTRRGRRLAARKKALTK